MDKRVILAVAGSGKTSLIVNRINVDSRCLIVTYTDNNTRHLKNSIIRKFGEIPKGVRVYSYFKFLYSFCYMPLYGHILKTKGMNFNHIKYSQWVSKSSNGYYIDKNRLLFLNRIAKLLIERDVIPDIIKRIEHFFDIICVDEIQDMAGNDFNFMCELAETNVEIQFVGDFYQHTFDTSRDGSTQKSLHSCFDKYCKKFKTAGFTVDLNYLSHSHRCSPSICAFIDNQLGIKIQSCRKDEVEISFVSDEQEIKNIYLNDSIVKLFYKESNKYSGNIENWGNVKGLDHYQDVCVVLNPNTLELYQCNKLANLASITKNKLYVACTRARGNLYFVPEEPLKKYRKQ